MSAAVYRKFRDVARDFAQPMSADEGLTVPHRAYSSGPKASTSSETFGAAPSSPTGTIECRAIRQRRLPTETIAARASERRASR